MEYLAEESRKEGDKLAEQGRCFEAIIQYTKGIKLDPHNPNIYSNRSAAFLRVQQYFYALEDASTVIRILPRFAKGYCRKGEVECAAEHFKEAAATYRKGLEMCPGDATLLKCLETAIALWKKQRQAEGRMPWYGIALGAVVGILLIVADETLSNKPMLTTDWMRSVVLASLVFVCYCIARLYRFFLRSQRNSRLEMLGDDLSDEDAAALLNKPVAPAKMAAEAKSAKVRAAAISTASNSSYSKPTSVQQRKK